MIALMYEASAQPYGMTARPMVGRFLNNKLPPDPPRISTAWSTEVAFPGLTFSFPLGLVPMPGTGDLVVWEREGRVWAFANDPAATTRRPVLNITNRCQGWMECGLLGLAFHPGFATNRFMFVYYNWVPPGTVVRTARRTSGIVQDIHPCLPAGKAEDVRHEAQDFVGGR